MTALDLGRLAYRPAWAEQLRVWKQVQNGADDTLIFVEHDPVLTLGASFHESNLLFSAEEYRRQGIDVVTTDRGGDVTYHGTGQLVIYPVFNLTRHGKDLHKWLRNLEQAMIECLAGFGIPAQRYPPHTGVWIPGQQPKKAAAIGIKVKKWISLHGIALNCDNDLSPFQMIVPCGIHGYGVTSLTEALGRQVTIEEAKPMVLSAFRKVFSEPDPGT